MAGAGKANGYSCFRQASVVGLHRHWRRMAVYIAEVIDRLGRPDGVQTQGTTELLTYVNRFMSDWSWDKADYQVLLNNGIVVQYGAVNIYRDTGAAARMMAAGQIMQQNKPVQTRCNQFGTSVYCSSY